MMIMVGEIRDPETLETAIEASLTGHLVLSTLHIQRCGDDLAADRDGTRTVPARLERAGHRRAAADVRRAAGADTGRRASFEEARRGGMRTRREECMALVAKGE